jgi:hypothetical protein
MVQGCGKLLASGAEFDGAAGLPLTARLFAWPSDPFVLSEAFSGMFDFMDHPPCVDPFVI